MKTDKISCIPKAFIKGKKQEKKTEALILHHSQFRVSFNSEPFIGFLLSNLKSIR
jgi:hypothetical protein